MNRSLLALTIALAMFLGDGRTLAREPALPPLPAPEINLRHTVTVDIFRKAKDAVVNISTTKVVNQRRISPFTRDPFWMFDADDVPVQTRSLGSGFIIHSDGYIVTNHHVIDRATQIRVELADGRKLPADLISSDPEADLAILKINAASDGKTAPRPFPALELGDSSDLMIGEPVIAVGNPMGYSHSVSTGIVSAIHRDLKDSRGKVMLNDLVQTDAAINPGNSGGPLLNAYGQVIGINTAIRGDAQNIGFAIQVNRLRDLVPELMNPLHVTRTEVPLRLREQRRLTPPARIECEVTTLGERAQVVRAINGKRPANIVDAYAILLRVRPDQMTLAVQFADGTASQVAVRPAPVPPTVLAAHQRLGITVEPVTPTVAERFSLQTGSGLFISEVAKGGVAAQAGLKPGDVITQFSRYPVATLDDLGNVLQQLPDHGRVRVSVIRGDQVGYTVLEF